MFKIFLGVYGNDARSQARKSQYDVAPLLIELDV